MKPQDLEVDEIDIDDIESDPELLAELAKIGQEIDLETNFPSTIRTAPAPAPKKVSTKATAAALIHTDSINLDISHLVSSNADHMHVDFNEDDENDPELLAALEDLKKDSRTSDVGNSIGSEPLTTTSSASAASVKVSAPQAKPSISPTSPSPTPAVSNSNVQLIAPKLVKSVSSTTPTTSTASPKSAALITQYKQKALACKKEGRLDEAKEWLMKAKNLEKSGEIKGANISSKATSLRSQTSTNSFTSKSSVSITTVPTNTTTAAKQAKERDLDAMYESIAATTDAFGPLEHALKEAAGALLADAKREKEAGNKKKYESITTECKKYIQELEVLKARRHIPGALPALFRWQAVKKEKKIENLDISEDQAVLEIRKASRLQSLLQNNSSRSVVLTYDLGFPKDAPFTGKLTGTIDAQGDLKFDFTSVIAAGIKRSAHSLTANSMTRKKAQFNLTLKRGMFYSDLPLGEVSLPLSDLQSKCECGGILPIMQEDDKGRRKSVGGTLEVYIRLRSPISQPQVEITEDRVLVIGPWPEVGQVPVLALPAPIAAPSVPAVASSAPSPTKAQSSTKPAASSSGAPPPTKSAAIASATAAPKKSPTPDSSSAFADVSNLEKSDPLNVSLLVSNDVLEAEAQAINAQLATKIDADTKAFLEMRLLSVNISLSTLEQGVTSGGITMEGYLGMLKDRVAKDQRLVQYLSSRGADERDLDVEKKVKQRMIIMLKEIKGAEENMNDA